MPRESTYSKREMTHRAMKHFWVHGYHASSMSDLVNATQVSRHRFYTEFDGKHDLFLACIELYDEEVVTPAFSRIESTGAGIEAVAHYLKFQIARAEQAGLPGPGCLIANTLTEIAPHDPEVHAAAQRHNRRLKKGIATALRTSSDGSLSSKEIADLAFFVVASAQGFWSMSRSVTDARILRRYAATLIKLIHRRLKIDSTIK